MSLDLDPKTSSLKSYCSFLTRPLLTVADVSVLEEQRVARKKLLGGTKKLKKLFERKKVAYKAWLLNKVIR